MDRSDDIRKTLRNEDDEFRRLAQEHSEHETRLAQLAQKPTLTPDEEIEEKRLKKRKLMLKDQMAAKIRGYETAHAFQT